MSFEIVQIPVLNDNYVFLVHDHKSNKTAVIDPVRESMSDAIKLMRGKHMLTKLRFA